MQVKIIVHFYISVIFLLASCTCNVNVTHDINDFKDAKICIYKHGNLDKEFNVSIIEKNLLKNLNKELSGSWCSSIITYAPSVIIYFKNGNINFLNGSTIMNLNIKEAYHGQFIREQTSFDKKVLANILNYYNLSVKLEGAPYETNNTNNPADRSGDIYAE